MTHSGTAPCTAEADANWTDSPLRDRRAGRKKRPGNAPKEAGLGAEKTNG